MLEFCDGSSGFHVQCLVLGLFTSWKSLIVLGWLAFMAVFAREVAGGLIAMVTVVAIALLVWSSVPSISPETAAYYSDSQVRP